MKEFIGKPSQSLSLTSHNLQNIAVSLMKAAIYISQTLPLGESPAVGRFTFKVLMKLHFFLRSSSVGSFVAFWSYCSLTEGPLRGARQCTSRLARHPFIRASPNPQILPRVRISRPCFSLLICLWICHFITRELTACLYSSHESILFIEGSSLLAQWLSSWHTSLSP